MFWTGSGLLMFGASTGACGGLGGLFWVCAPIFKACQIIFFIKTLFFYILPHKIPACQVFDWFHFAPENGRGLQKSPGSAAFNIYIAFAPDKGDTTEVWLAEVRSLRYFKQLKILYTHVVAQYDFSKMTPYRTHLIYI